MGQAKHRGTYEQRKATPKGRVATATSRVARVLGSARTIAEVAQRADLVAHDGRAYAVTDQGLRRRR